MTLRIAQLGSWHVHARHHVDAARAHPGTTPVVVWDSRPGAAAEFGAAVGLPHEERLEALLARKDIDAVVVDTATTEHPAVIAAALEAGKHVFSEKVLAVRTEDAERLVALAERRGLVLRVSLQRLGDPAIRTAAALIDAGELGQVTSSRIRWAHHGAVGTPWIPEHFFSLADTGGGALIDLGAHPVYLAMRFHGRVPEAVHTSLGHVTGREVEDNAVLAMDFGGGVLSVAETSMVSNHLGGACEISGTAGSVVIGPADERVMLRRGQQGAWEPQPLSEPLPDTFAVWADQVVAGTDDPAHLPTVLAVTRVLEAGYRSAATGTTVRLGSS